MLSVSIRKIVRNGAFLLAYLLSASTTVAQSVKKIRDYEEWCRLGQYGQGHTPVTQKFIDCVNHYIGPALILAGLAEEYTGPVTSYESSRRYTQGH